MCIHLACQLLYAREILIATNLVIIMPLPTHHFIIYNTCISSRVINYILQLYSYTLQCIVKVMYHNYGISYSSILFLCNHNSMIDQYHRQSRMQSYQITYQPLIEQSISSWCVNQTGYMSAFKDISSNVLNMASSSNHPVQYIMLY